ncbi:unnamed protein product, partial [Meganyctiphanes norvegica]
MPQGGGGRSVAFSGKKKKEQLRARKERKINIPNPKYNNSEVEEAEKAENSYISVVTDALEAIRGPGHLDEVEELNLQPRAQQNSSSKRYNLKFKKDKDEEKERLKTFHYAKLDTICGSDMEVEINDFYPPGLNFPTRPAWRKNMSKKELDHQENRYFRLFCDKLDKDFAHQDLSLYELNLETWRQLWRVMEMADILLIIVDARYVACQFPPYLYEELSEKRNKNIILVMNKCDLIPPELVLAWEKYLMCHFPSLLLVPFSSLEGVRKKRGLMRMAAESSLRLVEACQKLVGGKVNLDSWRNKIEEERDITFDEECEVQENIVEEPDTSPLEHQRFNDGILTIGTIGHPNVGKSSLINALMGKKVVSVSRTPGHTKHFQTIFLTPKVKLCDCPGLVFPSKVSKPMQVLHGSYPIAQYRDPISAVHYMASRINVPQILKLQHPEKGTAIEWTPYFISEAWAKKRGFFLKSKGGRPDTSRGANELLRLCLNGHRSLIMYIAPPGFHENIHCFENDEKLKDIILIQGIKKDNAIEELEELQEGQLILQDNSEESDDEDQDMASEAPCRNPFELLMDDEY